MLYVRIELWPSGDRSKAKLLQELTVANVGGDENRGDYEAKLSHSTTFYGNGFEDPAKPKLSELWKRGRVAGFDRKNGSPAELVARALLSMLRIAAPKINKGGTT